MHTRASDRRYVGVALVACLAIEALAGCGGGQVTEVGRPIATGLAEKTRALVQDARPNLSSGEMQGRAAKALEETFRFAASSAESGPLREVGLQFADAFGKSQTIVNDLDRLAASDDPFGEAIAIGMCRGFDAISTAQASASSQTEAASDESWTQYLEAMAQKLLPNNPVARVNTAVDEFTETANLAQVNPRLAYYYVRECVAAGKR